MVIPHLNIADKERATHWAILFVGLLALCLRLFRLDGHSLWDDELYSVGLVSLTGPWFSGVDIGKSPHLLELSDSFWTWKLSDPHPPLYELCLAVWVKLFGVSDWAVRSLSACLGAATVAVALRVPQSLGTFSRLIFAVLLATSPMLVFYSQEARSYVLGTLLAACLCVELLRVLTNEQAVAAHGIPPWPLLATGSLLCFSHYYGALLVLPTALATVLHQHQRGGKFWGSALGWGVALSPVIAYIGVARSGIFVKLGVPTPEQGSLWHEFGHIFRLFGQALMSVEGILSLVILLAMVGAIWIRSPAVVLSTSHTELNKRQRRVQHAAAYLACVCGAYLLLLAEAVRHADFFHVRYLIFAIPLGLLLLAMATGMNNWRQIASALTVAGLVPFGLQQWMHIQMQLPQHSGEWRGAAQFVTKVHAPGDLVVAPHRATRMYYAHYLSRYIPLPLDTYLLGIDDAAQMVQEIKAKTAHPSKIIVFSHKDFRGVAMAMEALALQHYGCIAQDRRIFGALQVVVTVCPQPAEPDATAPPQS